MTKEEVREAIEVPALAYPTSEKFSSGLDVAGKDLLALFEGRMSAADIFVDDISAADIFPDNEG